MPKRLMTSLYWFLAFEFALGAVTKYWPGDTIFSSAYSVKFVEWGYPSWMRFVVGALEAVAAVLLAIPHRRTRFLGAATLMFVLTGAATTHIVNHDPAVESWAAPTHLVIMGILALANWPADWRDLLRAPAPAGRNTTSNDVTTAFALTTLTPADEARIAAPVKQAAS